MSGVRTFSANVRVGNWSEDISLDEDVLKDFLARKERGELIVQKTSFLKRNILKETNLSVTTDELVHFGDTVMLRESLTGIDPFRHPSSLSINADTTNVGTSSSIVAPCGMSASTNVTPCVRNSFIIERSNAEKVCAITFFPLPSLDSVDGTPAGEPLTYGQSFALRTTQGFAGELYLKSDHKTFEKCALKSRLQEVSLTDQPSFLSCWQAVYHDPQLRLEYEGCPVPANSKVLISHCKTNQCLAALENYTLLTLYGKEYEVTAHTYLDSHKAERDLNHWLLVTRNPGKDAPTMIDRPEPPVETTRTPAEGAMPQTVEEKPQTVEEKPQTMEG
ncbi:UNVERIFIED_CONTAM: hypothetical protein FKN15_067919 [Acipenser sinensis]